MRETLAPLPKPHADLLGRFTRWNLLRRLSKLEAHGNVTRGAVQHAPATILASIRFLTWLEEHNIAMPDLTQSILDHCLIDHPETGPSLALSSTGPAIPN
ncbi:MULTISPECIES: hypothetical protein [Nocardia]|uniref:Uncharacterized protein n=1 Tax=Nocardia sputorum TaxID=2984338 RepID=A0ABN6U6S7_9NOCA|nr:hypothetical protein [Nocardia sputorum]BDU00992.1 hypothetical protein IFM12276_40200 [Nocardia sputorum]